jgi:hypothetical protein
MSEIMLSVCDATGARHGTVHASHADYAVAALSADPDTIEEWQAALARFLPAGRRRDLCSGLRPGRGAEPWDAGVCILDLAARLVVVQSTYSDPGPRGTVSMTDARQDEDALVPYHVADDWLFTHELEHEQVAAAPRRARRAAPPLDARAVLYGEVCAFIAEACWSEAPEGVRAIHARWLTEPRSDLGGRAPRDVLLARREHLMWDLQDRAQQWSLLGACPPGLSPESAAYRYGGFGTHEIVLYYDLVRFLLCDCWEHWPGAGATAEAALAAEVRRLEALRDEWLATPEFEDLHGRTPASVIERERARLPEAVTGAEAMVDHDCPLCQMMADAPGPMFWSLDGCNMDDDFAFSFHRTREAWEAERREQEDFHRRLEEERRSRQGDAAGSAWQTSFTSAGAPGDTPALMLFGLGAHLAELVQDLKDAGAGPEDINGLNLAFGNLRAAAEDPAASLVGPVSEQMSESLASLAETFPVLAEKCGDLQRHLSHLHRRLTGEPDGEDELPF